MTYAGPRTILDADSHVMELGDFLDAFIDPSQRDRLRREGVEALQGVLDSAVARAEERRADPAKAAEAEERLLVDKGWLAMGAFDPAERSRVLDLFGFQGQLVFATFAGAMYRGKDVERLYAGASAQNKAMSNFCAGDQRLLPVAFVPLGAHDLFEKVATIVVIALGCDEELMHNFGDGVKAQAAAWA